MPSKLRSILALAAMALLGWICATQSKSVAETKSVAESDVPQNVQQWEYQIEKGSSFDVGKANTLGSRGWELVTAYHYVDYQVEAVYKRKKN